MDQGETSDVRPSIARATPFTPIVDRAARGGPRANAVDRPLAPAARADAAGRPQRPARHRRGRRPPGPGKSVVASNLAVAIGGLGRQVALVDLDVGAPRQHALFGVKPAVDFERPTGVRNVKLWPAAAAARGAPPTTRPAGP